MLGAGDRIRTAELISRDPIARDNSFLKYDLVPDANTAFRRQADQPYRQTQYGQLLDIYHVEFMDKNNQRTRFILARVLPCDTNGQDAALRANPVVTYKKLLPARLIHVQTVIAVVGRVRLANEWAIVDRSRGMVRPTFVDDDGNELD
ncbi:hypothetical protein FRC08_012954 [Ceratobasidium sp. 394]|nr:hypothetical protein FRC08_012954 [Ceratobasidium sp. 394]